MSAYSFSRGYKCPRCDGETEIFYDRGETVRCGWVCPKDDCHAVGFGFRGRRSARIGLREFREEVANEHREYR